MSLPWAAYCGPWEWPRHFQCTPTPHARFPACAYISLSCRTLYIYLWSSSEDDQASIRIPLCVSLHSIFCHFSIHFNFSFSNVIMFLILLIGYLESERRTQSFGETYFQVLLSRLSFPRMLVHWRIALRMRSPHLLLAFVISRVKHAIFSC
jgi:K+-sensing histidine kinase KdpD